MHQLQVSLFGLISYFINYLVVLLCANWHGRPTNKAKPVSYLTILEYHLIIYPSYFLSIYPNILFSWVTELNLNLKNFFSFLDLLCINYIPLHEFQYTLYILTRCPTFIPVYKFYYPSVKLFKMIGSGYKKIYHPMDCSWNYTICIMEYNCFLLSAQPRNIFFISTKVYFNS